MDVSVCVWYISWWCWFFLFGWNEKFGPRKTKSLRLNYYASLFGSTNILDIFLWEFLVVVVFLSHLVKQFFVVVVGEFGLIKLIYFVNRMFVFHWVPLIVWTNQKKKCPRKQKTYTAKTKTKKSLRQWICQIDQWLILFWPFSWFAFYL